MQGWDGECRAARNATCPFRSDAGEGAQRKGTGVKRTRHGARKSATRVIMYGEYGCGNFGNEASLDVVLDWVRALGLEVGSITREPDVVTAQHGIASRPMYADRSRPRVLPLKLRQILGKGRDIASIARYLGRGDVVLIAGTGVLEEKLSGAPWGLPLSMMGVSWAVRARRARLGLVGIGASSDSRGAVRWMTRQLLEGVEFLSFRDQQSKDGMLEDGMPVGRWPIFPDVAFGSPTDAEEDTPAPGSPLSVGVGLLSYYDPVHVERGAAVAERYTATMVDFCGWLVEKGHRVHLLVGDASDEPVAREILAAVRLRHPASDTASNICFEPTATYQELRANMSALDVIVAARYHNLIFGLLAGRPVIGIEYAEKTRSLLQEVGLGDFVVKIEDVELQALQRMFDTLLLDYAANRYLVLAYLEKAAANTQRHQRAVQSFITQ